MSSKNPIVRWFEYSHLPNQQMKEMSRQFSLLAMYVENNVKDGPEKSTALRKLLEGKDAAVRAVKETQDS